MWIIISAIGAGIASGTLVVFLYYATKHKAKLHALALEKEQANKIFEAKEKDLDTQKEILLKETTLKEKFFEEKEKKILETEKQCAQIKKACEKEILEQKHARLKKEAQFDKREQDCKKEERSLQMQQRKYENDIQKFQKEKENVQEFNQKKIRILEELSKLSSEEAKNTLIRNIQKDAEKKASVLVQRLIEEAELKAAKKAKKIVISTIQRVAAEHTVESTASIFHLPNEDYKGKIIGREGRNIRAFEHFSGVNLLVDDTPEAITITSFDPLRREIAMIALRRLLEDGRIHPGHIEEVLIKAKDDMEQEILEIGEKTLIDLDISHMHADLIRMVGRMRFRSSYGQNLLQHSKEVANLSAVMAAELGLHAKHAKRAGLLHDIGKCWSQKTETPHALIGMELAKKCQEHEEVCNAIGAHHEEIEMKFLISPIIQACDAISSSRPGARYSIREDYIQRIKDMEEVATQFHGVKNAYAIQAGRELRVITDAVQMNDQKVEKLAFDISQKIEKNMQYPGQIKVTVIREMRSISFAH